MFKHSRQGIGSTRACFAILLVFCSAFSFTTFLFHSNKTSFMKPNTFFSKAPQLRFLHLQPLIDMFTDLTEVTPSRKDCMLATSEFSDLKELETKKPVFLIIIVSTAPSRHDRREAIRQTWWTKCQGEVSIALLETKIAGRPEKTSIEITTQERKTFPSGCRSSF